MPIIDQVKWSYILEDSSRLPERALMRSWLDGSDRRCERGGHSASRSKPSTDARLCRDGLSISSLSRDRQKPIGD